MNHTNTQNKNVKYYLPDGTPVFKKRIKEVNILNMRSAREKVIFNIAFVMFLIQSLTLIFGVVWMLISSFKNPVEYVAVSKAFSLPEVWRWNNYIEAFENLIVNEGSYDETNFFGMLFNSIWYTLVVTALHVFVPTVTGYVFSKYDFRGKSVMFSIAVTAMMIPVIGSSASNMKLYSALGLKNTPLYAVVSSLGGFGATFIVYYGFFKSVSWSYAEAVMIDGGGPYTIFFKIMLPQATPIMFTYALTGAIANWNEYTTMILYLPSYPTLASGLFEYKANSIRGANYPVYYAGLIISMIPTLAIFSVFSNKIMTSLSMGGLKE